MDGRAHSPTARGRANGVALNVARGDATAVWTDDWMLAYCQLHDHAMKWLRLVARGCMQREDVCSRAHSPAARGQRARGRGEPQASRVCGIASRRRAIRPVGIYADRSAQRAKAKYSVLSCLFIRNLFPQATASVMWLRPSIHASTRTDTH